jgi:hypothetical protein
MQYGRPALRIVPYGTGDKYVPDRNAAGKDFTRGDAPAALDSSALPDPVIQSEPPLLTSTRLSEATLRSSVSSGAGSRRQRHTEVAT